MSKIVALLGYSGSGKDEIAKRFIEHDFKPFAFGDKVKEEYAKINNVSLEDLYNENKEKYRTGIINHAEAKRKINPNHWIDEIKEKVLKVLNQNGNVIFTDLRRIPEIDYISELKKDADLYDNVNLIYIERPKENGGKFDEDPLSSQAIMYAKFNNLIDMQINNSSSKEDLVELVEGIITSIIYHEWKS